MKALAVSITAVVLLLPSYVQKQMQDVFKTLLCSDLLMSCMFSNWCDGERDEDEQSSS